MELFLLTTEGLGNFYIVENDPTSARTRLTELLIKSDYGLSKDRKIINIEILASEISNFPKNKPNFSSGDRLIIPTSCTQIK